MTNEEAWREVEQFIADFPSVDFVIHWNSPTYGAGTKQLIDGTGTGWHAYFSGSPGVESHDRNEAILKAIQQARHEMVEQQR